MVCEQLPTEKEEEQGKSGGLVNSLTPRMNFQKGRNCVIHVLPVPNIVPASCHCLYINEPKSEVGAPRPRNRCNWSPLRFPASAAPSPLEVGQLLLQQEHVSFELIPLPKDLLKLLSTEAALPYIGRAPWLLWGISLWKDRFDQRGTSAGGPLPLGHHWNARGSDWHGDLGGKGATTDDRPVL